MTSLKKQSYKAFAWDFLGRVGGQFVSFVISIFLARILSPNDFGLLAMVNVIIALSASLMDMGLGVALIQRKIVTDEHYASVFFFNMAVGFLLAAILFFSAPLIGLFYNNEQLIPMARAMSLLFILNSIGNVIRIRLRKELEYSIPTQASLLGAFVSGIVGIAMAFNGYGVWSLVTQSLMNPIFNNIWLFYKIRWRPLLIFKWKALKELWSFGFRMFLSGILETVFNNLDSIIIGKLFSARTLGYYFRARSLNQYVIQYSSGSIMNVLLPAFSKVQDNQEQFKIIVYKGYHLIAFIAFMLTGFFFITGADIIILLFGSKWQPAIPYFQLIILTAYGYPISSIPVNILSASGNSIAILRLEIIKKILFGSSLLLGFFWGIEGYLAFNAIAYAIAVYMNIIFAGAQLGTGQWWFLKMTLPYAFLTLILAGIFHWIQNILNADYFQHLLIFGGLFIVFYTAISLFLKLDGIRILWKEIYQFIEIRKNKL